MTSPHPSMGRPVKWVIIADAGPIRFAPVAGSVSIVSTFDEGAGDAVVLDTMTASYAAPGVKPRPHAFVVRAWDAERGSYPALIIVTASYPPDPAKRPSGIEIVRNDGRLVGDAVLLARCAGLVLDTVLIEARLFDAYSRNERVDVAEAAREFFATATAALRATTP